jgi:branched-chain amino acid transport system substrate-binding protein
MRRVLIRQATATLSAAVVLLAGAGCAMLTGSSGPQTIYIGVDLPLSGDLEATGTVHHNALALRVEQVNAQRLAGEQYRLELRVLDNRSDAATAADNLATLADDPQVTAVVTAGCPSCASAAEPSVPLISLDTTDVLAEADERRWLFRLGPNPPDNADRLSQAMAQAGVDNVGLLAADDTYGQAGAAVIRDAADRDEISIAIDLPVSLGENDAVQSAAETVAAWRPEQVPPTFDPQTGDVQPAGPHAVVIWADAPLAAAAATALRRAGFDGPLFVDMAAASDLFLTEEQVDLDGATLVYTDTPVIDQMITASPAAAARADWFESYLSRYDTYHVHASWAADAINVLIAAIGRAGTTEPGAVRDQLETTRIDGFTGAIRFTAAQHSGLHPGSLLLLTATGGRWYPQTS